MDGGESQRGKGTPLIVYKYGLREATEPTFLIPHGLASAMDGKTIDTASLNGKLSSGDFEVSAQVVGTEVRHSTPARLRVCACGHELGCYQ